MYIPIDNTAFLSILVIPQLQIKNTYYQFFTIFQPSRILINQFLPLTLTIPQSKPQNPWKSILVVLEPISIKSTLHSQPYKFSYRNSTKKYPITDYEVFHYYFVVINHFIQFQPVESNPRHCHKPSYNYNK